MFQSEDDWIRATTDPLDFCADCKMHLTECECDTCDPHCTCPDCILAHFEPDTDMSDVEPCLYCGRAYPTFGLYPYCSAECSARAEAES